MKNNNYTKIKLRQSVWLLMACFCVVFSSAVKKVIQLHAERKISQFIHIDNDRTHPSQNLRVGYREKHEVQKIVLSDYKQIHVPAFNPSLHYSLYKTSSALLNLYTWTASNVSYSSSEALSSGPVPVYLLSGRLQV